MVSRPWSAVRRSWSAVHGRRSTPPPTLLPPHPSLRTAHSSLIFCGATRVVHLAAHMALLDLDKIIIKRTVIGIRCSVCGGNLQPTKKRSAVGTLVQLVSFGRI